MAASRRIRLVIFDMGETLMESCDDPRAVDVERTPVESMLDQDTMVEGPGRVRRLYPGVRDLFARLARRGTYVSIASLNSPHAYKWLGPAYFDLDVATLHFPVTEAGDSHDDTKGIWVEHIIDLFNRYVTPGDPIEPVHVLFVDDLVRCHHAVTKINPGVTCVFPMPHFAGGLLGILDVMAELEEST